MKLKNLKFVIIILCFFAIVLAGFYQLFFDNNISLSKYRSFSSLSKRNIGGIVYNKTGYSINVTDYKWVRTLPAGKSSRTVGIFDADGLIIDKPMYFENKKHSNEVLKFCDYAKIEILKENGKTVIKSKNKWLCTMLNDFDFYNSINEAFQ